MFAILFSVLAFFQVNLQDFGLKYFDTRSGLSNNIVYDIHQDQQGFLWVATENGLNRFDAYKFKVYHHSSKDSLSLSSNIVRSIFEHENGDLWFGTRNGLNLLDKKTETFRRFQIPDTFNISSNDVHVLRPDSENRLWYIANSRLINFDTENRIYSELTLPFSPYNFTIDKEDNIWITSIEGGVYKYIVGTEELQKLLIGPRSNINALFLENDGMSVLYDYSKQKLALKNWKSFPSLENNFKIERYLEDSQGRKWYGTEQGLFLRENDNKEIQKFNLEEYSGSILANIKAIFEDETGSIWIGSVNGLYQIDAQKRIFQHLPMNSANQMVMAIEEFDDSWWINNFSNQLLQYRYDSTSESLLNSITLPNGINQIWDIQPIDDEIIWLATEKGLFKLNTTTSESNKINIPDKDKSKDVVFSIIKTETNTAWIGSYGVLYQIEVESEQIINKIEILGNHVGALIQDILVFDERLLIATETHGLFSYSATNGLENNWENLETIEDLKQSSFWDLYQSGNGSVWIGGNNGLFRIPDPNDFTTLSKVDVLENFIVFSITEDNKKMLWLGTDKGLVQYNPESNRIRVFASEDEIYNREFNRRSIFTSTSGRVVVGGMSGVVYFNPDEIEINQNIPNVWVTSFVSILSDSTIQIPVYGTKKINLGWSQNTFEIDFTALNYTNSSQNKYQYQLVGHDPDWVIPENSRQARYVRVPAGEYTFKVIGSNNDGVWNRNGHSIDIKISPPFWQTNWFRLLVVLVIALIFWFLYRFRVRQLLEVERVRLRIAGDLHDEIGSGLSGIALAGDLLQLQAKKGVLKFEMIEKITTNARGLASSLDSIVWLIDPQKEKLIDLIIKCKRTANELLVNHQILLEDEITESHHNKELPPIMRRNYYLIFREVLHNVVKHANAQNVKIRFSVEDGDLIFLISDDGNGFDESKVLKGKGLDGIRSRAEEINAQLSISSKDLGTTIRLRKALP